MPKMKVDTNELIKRAKAATKPEKENYTFRLRVDLMEAFKLKAEESGVKQTAVLEEFLKVFTEKD